MLGIKSILGAREQDSYATLPGPTLPPFVGVANQFRRKSVQYLLDLSRTYGDYVRFPSPGIRGVLLSDPEAIRKILLQSERNFYKGKIYDLTKPLIGNGLVSNQGSSWRKNRKLANPAFTEKSLQDYEPHITSATRRAIAKIERQLDRDIDSTRLMMDLTFDVVSRALFSVSMDDKAKQLAAWFAEGQDYLGWLFWSPLAAPLWIPTDRNKRFLKARHGLHSYIRGLIQDRREHTPQGDLLQKLIETTDSNQKGFSESELIDEILTIMIAGHDTTALTLSYGLEQLSRSRNSVEKLREEIHRVCPRDPVQIKHLSKMPYLKNVLYEIMRLCPAVYMINRSNKKKVRFKQYTFAPDTTFFMSQYAVHRHPDHWDSPDLFVPDRWDNPELAKSPAFFPFGGGPRSCIGNHLAMFEAGLVLPEIIRRFDIIHANRKYAYDVNATMTPSPGVYLRFNEI